MADDVPADRKQRAARVDSEPPAPLALGVRRRQVERLDLALGLVLKGVRSAVLDHERLVGCQSLRQVRGPGHIAPH